MLKLWSFGFLRGRVTFDRRINILIKERGWSLYLLTILCLLSMPTLMKIKVNEIHCASSQQKQGKDYDLPNSFQIEPS